MRQRDEDPQYPRIHRTTARSDDVSRCDGLSVPRLDRVVCAVDEIGREQDQDLIRVTHEGLASELELRNPMRVPRRTILPHSAHCSRPAALKNRKRFLPLSLA